MRCLGVISPPQQEIDDFIDQAESAGSEPGEQEQLVTAAPVPPPTALVPGGAEDRSFDTRSVTRRARDAVQNFGEENMDIESALDALNQATDYNKFDYGYSDFPEPDIKDWVVIEMKPSNKILVVWKVNDLWFQPVNQAQWGEFGKIQKTATTVEYPVPRFCDGDTVLYKEDRYKVCALALVNGEYEYQLVRWNGVYLEHIGTSFVPCSDYISNH
jgi:hypothetical protein